MLKIFFAAGVLFLGMVGFVLAHGPEEEILPGDESMMKMDQMMGGMMTEHKDFDCAQADAHHLMDAGEEMMEKMLGGDKEKHEKFEAMMETEAGEEFHDMLHIMMGRAASGCFSDEEQNLMAQRLGITAGTAAPQDRSAQFAIFAGGLIGGAILGVIFASFLRKSV